MNPPAVLYISYDGMMEPLGQSQVLAYLERLTASAHIHLLSFEKPADLRDGPRRRAIAERISAAGIAWHPLTYHKSPSVPATMFDIAQGTAMALWLTARHRVRIIHARSYIAGLVGWVVKLLTGARLLFDMRGLWADERVDGGIWPPGGRIYRAVKRLERTLLLGADHIVTLTEASRVEIQDFSYMRDHRHATLTVIPTCADLGRFRPAGTSHASGFVLGYIGAVGTWHRFDWVLRCFAEVRKARPEARLLVVNRNEHDVVRAALEKSSVPEAAVDIRAATFEEMPGLVAGMTAGSAIRMDSYSQIACAPTKLAEYLGCGVPCLANSGVGDVETILESNRVGSVMHAFDDAECAKAVSELLAICDDPQTPARCRAVAERLFSADEGAARYAAIYRSLTA